ncbi:MAG TPA: hypothetical protein VNA19_11430 [Pyrinomonadaceae bacterium]|jgi:hypothetical protein|nr:hypothetical protein [Pyrinomonadaceae bacterium]
MSNEQARANETKRTDEREVQRVAADERDGERIVADEPPPIGGSWTTLYTIVLVTLGVLIIVFYIFTKAFSR